MQKVIVILVVLLFPKHLPALRCYTCSGSGTETCTVTECPSSSQCYVKTRTSSSEGRSDSHGGEKGCYVASEAFPPCGERASLNGGIMRSQENTKCCSTDLCNDAPYSKLPAGSPNGKTCFACGEGWDCSHKAKCLDDEDQCITYVEHNGVTVKACASMNHCRRLEGKGASRCCKGDLCNGATSTAVSLLLLLAAPVVSVALFH